VVHTPCPAILNRCNWMSDLQRLYRPSLCQQRYCICSRGIPEGQTFRVVKFKVVGRQGPSTLPCNRRHSDRFFQILPFLTFFLLSPLRYCTKESNSGHLDTIPTICRIRYFAHSLLPHLVYDTRRASLRLQKKKIYRIYPHIMLASTRLSRNARYSHACNATPAPTDQSGIANRDWK
jgi:hypothetical protein